MVLVNRGQERNKSTLILFLLAALVIIILAALFFTGFFSKSDARPESLPPSLQRAITICQEAAQSDSIPQYCKTLREIVVDGDIRYADCEENAIEKNFAPDAKQLDCGTNKFTDQQIKLFCESNKLSPSTIVVGKTCQSVGAA